MIQQHLNIINSIHYGLESLELEPPSEYHNPYDGYWETIYVDDYLSELPNNEFHTFMHSIYYRLTYSDSEVRVYEFDIFNTSEYGIPREYVRSELVDADLVLTIRNDKIIFDSTEYVLDAEMRFQCSTISDLSTAINQIDEIFSLVYNLFENREKKLQEI